MNTYTSPFFGEINLDKVKEDYDAEFQYDNRTLAIDINFENKGGAIKDRLTEIDAFLKNLAKYETEISAFINLDFKNEGVTKEYIKHHAEELDAAELDALVDRGNKELSIEEQLLSKLYIHSVGFYPDNNFSAILDCRINHKVSDEILVVVIENDSSYDITWER
ncbi:MAG: DUF2004 domain-containing protein [Saprospiraceae bacterium]